MSSNKNLLVDLWLAAAVATPLLDDAVTGSGVTTDEFAIYGLITDLAPVSAADLARITGLPPTTVSGLLSRCERRGHLHRVPSPTDGRARLIELTEEGAAVYAELLPRLRHLLVQLDGALPRPEAEVRAAMQALDDALRRLRGIAPRPYRVPGDGDPPAIAYDGAPLSDDQAREVRAYVDWVRHRDAARTRAPSG